jgi:branched-chain amino acid transport system substrate-binding protein
VGGATFFGPWKVNHAWAQAAQKKPLVIGLTMDASGQYAASGVEERLGAMMAIREFNAKGGVLGRKIEWITTDTETNPATATRVAERFIAQEQCAFLVGALHSGVANAITQVAAKYGVVYINMEPAPGEGFDFVNKVKGGNIPSEFIPAVEKGCEESMETGVRAGYPMVDVRVTREENTYPMIAPGAAAREMVG